MYLLGGYVAIILLCFIFKNSTFSAVCFFVVVVITAYVVPPLCRKYEVHIIPSSLRLLYGKIQEQRWSRILLLTTWVAWFVIINSSLVLLNEPKMLNEMQVIVGTIIKIETGPGGGAIPYFDIQSTDGNVVRLSFFGISTRLPFFKQIKEKADIVTVWFAKEFHLYGRSDGLWVKQIQYNEQFDYKYSLKKREANYSFAKLVFTISATYVFIAYALCCLKYSPEIRQKNISFD